MSSTAPPAISAPTTRKGLSIQALRNLIFAALFVGLGAFTAIMFTLTEKLSERFGPQVHADLVWRVERGAQELSRTTDLGLAVGDADMVKEAFGAYTKSSDVQAIVAVDASGKLVAGHGQAPEGLDKLFTGDAGKVRAEGGYLVSWAPAEIEGGVVGKVAVVVSTARQTDAEALLASVSRAALIAGGVMLVFGLGVIGFFTHAVVKRDAQLKDYAANLERKVEARTAELDERNAGMRLVLDNVDQGFLTIDARGVLAAERSAIVDTWFGEPAAGATFAALVAPHSPDFGAWFPVAFEALIDDVLPEELSLAQLPARITTPSRTFDVRYSPIRAAGKIERLLLIVSDVTEHLIRQQAEREQLELVTLFQRISADRNGFDDFVAETNGLVEGLATPATGVVERRVVHTLKGNAGLYGLESYAELCHGVEDEIADHDEPLTAAQRRHLADGWRIVLARVDWLLGDVRRDMVEVPFDELTRLAERAKQGVSSRDLGAILTSWTHELVNRRFERLGRHARALGRRLDKGDIAVDIPESSLRLDASRWAPFWGSLIHAVRNAIDHGLESPTERVAQGKPAVGTLRFAALRGEGSVTIAVSDDGKGIAWEAIRRKAAKAGLPAATEQDLIEALFADGVSSREQATDVSGRGIGMSALREAVRDLGGKIEIDTAAGEGTTFRFVFPHADAQILPMRPPTQPIRIHG